MVGFGLTDIGERGGATQDGKTLNPKQFESVTYQILIKPKQRWKIKNFISLWDFLQQEY